MRHKERAAWMALLEAEREAHRKQVQELLNRIAAPEKRITDVPVLTPEQIEAKEQQMAELAREHREMAYIGGIVPDGVSVGSAENNGHSS